jgi:hypothetical protein
VPVASRLVRHADGGSVLDLALEGIADRAGTTTIEPMTEHCRRVLAEGILGQDLRNQFRESARRQPALSGVGFSLDFNRDRFNGESVPLIGCGDVFVFLRLESISLATTAKSFTMRCQSTADRFYPSGVRAGPWSGIARLTRSVSPILGPD